MAMGGNMRTTFPLLRMDLIKKEREGGREFEGSRKIK
jgi:hypothetical protein